MNDSYLSLPFPLLAGVWVVIRKKNRETKFIVYIVHCQKMSLSEDFTEKKRNSSAELVIKKMQIKTTIKFHFTPILTIISNSDKFLDCVGGE